ncbi:MAG: hypothetical protein LUG55_00535, partial [Clostridiales bacterium]|nr:hypothetical protein [Clostridiales bacterium]
SHCFLMSLSMRTLKFVELAIKISSFHISLHLYYTAFAMQNQLKRRRIHKILFFDQVTQQIGAVTLFP